MIEIDKEFLRFCEKLGKDNTFVQGAGGNISIKDREYLYIKGSGKWISNAVNENIFAILPLKESRDKLNETGMEHIFSNDSLNNLRPSIETSFHLLIDSKMVIHLHETFSLSILILKEYKSILKSFLPKSFSYAFIDYVKPGTDLAKAIDKELNGKNKCDILFLQNHGIIVCGERVEEIESKINILRSGIKDFLNKSFKPTKRSSNIGKLQPSKSIEISCKEYHLISQESPCMICNNDLFMKHLNLHWAYSPDHIVFLGERASIFNSVEDAKNEINNNHLIFIKNVGIYYSGKNPLGVIDQLECFKKVFLNILEGNHEVNTLEKAEIHSLLNWEQERFRQSISK